MSATAPAANGSGTLGNAGGEKVTAGHGFGTAPVFLASISTILGAILFLRFGYAVGNVGLRQYGAADQNPDFRDEGERGFDNLFTGAVLAR